MPRTGVRVAAGEEEPQAERLHSAFSPFPTPPRPGKEEFVATFKGNEFFCYDLSHNPIQSSTDEITLAFRTLQRNGLMLHTGKSADYVNLSLKSGAVWLVINLGSGAFEALVEPVNGKFNDNAWHDVRVTRNLRQVGGARRRRGSAASGTERRWRRGCAVAGIRAGRGGVVLEKSRTWGCGGPEVWPQPCGSFRDSAVGGPAEGPGKDPQARARAGLIGGSSWGLKDWGSGDGQEGASGGRGVL